MRLKKGSLFIGLILGILSIMGLFSHAQAATATTSKTLNMKAIRSSGYGYKVVNNSTKRILKIYNTTHDINETFYCIKGGPGFGSSSMDTATSPAEYTEVFDMRKPSTITATYQTALSLIYGTKDYERLMWVLDQCYIPAKNNASTEDRKIAEDSKTALLNAVETYAKKYPQIYENTSNIYDRLVDNLTNDDIDSIQQLAVWYYTNNDDYHVANNPNIQLGYQDNTYSSLNSNDEEDNARIHAMNALFAYLTQTPQASGFSYNYQTDGDTSNPVEIAQTNPSIEVSGDRYIIGPYRINQLRNITYTLNATITDGNGITITDVKYLNSSKTQLATSTTVQDLVGQTFYVSIPATANISKIKMHITGNYFDTAINYWSVKNPSIYRDQPVVQVEKGSYSFSEESEVNITGSYQVQLEKVDSESHTKKLSGAQFTYQLPGAEEQQSTTNENGIIDLGRVEITNINDVDTITITEETAPEGYNKLIDSMSIQVRKGISNGKYVATNAIITEGNVVGADVAIEDNIIKITVPNDIITGYYQLQLEKVDSNDNTVKLSGAEFEYHILGSTEQLQGQTNGSGILNLGVVNITNPKTVDNLVITETKAPEGYNKLIEQINLQITKGISNGSYIATKAEITEGNVAGTNVTIEENVIKITIPNSKITGHYQVQLEKVDNDDNTIKLPDAQFSYQLPKQTETIQGTTGTNGTLNLGTIAITDINTVDNITITETKAPEGYNKLIEQINLQITKGISNGSYIATKAEITEGNVAGTHVTIEENVIKITVPNSKITGHYQVQLEKVDSENHTKKLSGAQFTYQLSGAEEQQSTTNENGIIDLGRVEIININDVDTITITEETAPEGYNKLIDSMSIQVRKGISNGKYVATNAIITEGNVVGADVAIEDNIIKITVPNDIITGYYQLQLEKVDSNDNTVKLSGAEFEYHILGSTEQLQGQTNGSGILNLGVVNITDPKTVDNLVITETKAPEGYNKLIEQINLQITKGISNGSYIATKAEITEGNIAGTNVTIEENVIKITVPNSKITGHYQVQLEKVDSENHTKKLSGAQFTYQLPGTEEQQATTNENGAIDLGRVEITEINGADTIIITENTAPEGYNKLIDSMSIQVTKGVLNGEYIATTATITEGSVVGADVAIEDNIIKITVPNDIITGYYQLQLEKVDSNDNTVKLSGAEFEYHILGSTEQLQGQTNGSGILNLGVVNITDPKTVDNLVITETKAPEGYNKLIEQINLQITKGISNGSYIATKAEITEGNIAGTDVTIEENVIKITIPNSKITGHYQVQLEKVDSNDNTIKLPGAQFTYQLPGTEEQQATTNENGIIDLGRVEITEINGADTIIITENTAPEGYNKLIGSMSVQVAKGILNGEYVATDATITGGEVEGASVTIQDNIIKIKVPNKRMEGTYQIQLEKVDSDDNTMKLSGAEFSYTLPGTTSVVMDATDSNGILNLGTVQITNTNQPDEITIIETKAPDGYKSLMNMITVQVTKGISEGKYVATNATITTGNIDGLNIIVENNIIKIKVPNKRITGYYQVQLEKVDSNDNTVKLQGAQFNYQLPRTTGELQGTTDENGILNLGTVRITEINTADTIQITETTAPDQYNKLLENITIQVTKGVSNGAYVATEAHITDGNIEGSNVVIEDNTIKITVPNKKMTGSYQLQLEKVDSDNHAIKLSGAQFSYRLPNSAGDVQETTNEEGIIKLGTVTISDITTNDTIRITEDTAPEGYNKLINSLTLQVTKGIAEEKYVATSVAITSGNIEGASANIDGDTIKITVPNKRIIGYYQVQLEKVDSNDSTVKIQGAQFKYQLPGAEEIQTVTNEKGIIDLGRVEITDISNADTISVTETTAPEGYNKLINSIILQVTKGIKDGNYIATNVDITSGKVEGLNASINGNIIKITVPNNRITGFYQLQLEKVDSDNNVVKLSGAQFAYRIPGATNDMRGSTNIDGILNLGTVQITDITIKDTITITEITAPEGYQKLIDSITVEVTKGITDGNYIATHATITTENVEGTSANIDGNTIKITVPNKKITGSYQLQLEKVDLEDNRVKLSGAQFTYRMPTATEDMQGNTNADGILNLGTIQITDTTTTDIVTITENVAPAGYQKLIDTMIIEISKGVANGYYVATNATITTGNIEGTSARIDGNTIKITIPNQKITGSYQLQLEKVDSDDNTIKLLGAQFRYKLPNTESDIQGNTNADGILNLGTVQITDITTKDTIAITETTAPEGYQKLIDSITVEVTKGIIDGNYIATNATITTENTEGTSVNIDGNIIKITVPNKKITGSYEIEIEKVNVYDQTVKLEGAQFSYVLPRENETKVATTDNTGILKLGTVQISNIDTTDIISITETTAPEGYQKLIESITVEITKGVTDGNYVVTGAQITSGNVEGTNIEMNGNIIKIRVPNRKITGSYQIQLEKVDLYDNNIKLEGAEFRYTLPNTNQEEVKITNSNGILNLGTVQINDINNADIINITESTAPTGYKKLINSITLEIAKAMDNGNYIATRATITSGATKGATVTLNNNMIKITVPNERKIIDLALRKFITTIQSGDITTSYEEARTPKIENTDLESLLNREMDTVDKKHPKNALKVKTGDIVTYKIRVYNEGNTEAYATEVTDYLPAGLEMVEKENSEINRKYQWEVSQDGKTITTSYLANTTLAPLTSSQISYQDLEIECRVVAIAGEKTNLKNIAAITQYADEEKMPIDTDEDSQPNQIENREPDGYKPKDPTNGHGEQDDDDFEDLELEEPVKPDEPKKEFDLSLRKFISDITTDGKSHVLVSREPIVDVTPLLNGQTTAHYNHTKQPLKVSSNDIVTYTIRVYNEGEIDGFVTEITDYLPPQLEFLIDDELNKQYGWQTVENSNGRTVKTNATSGKLIRAFGYKEGDALDYIDVQIRCRVKENISLYEKITNIAEITEFTDSEGNEVVDRDSQEENVVLPTDDTLPEYKDPEIESKIPYIPGQQDDDDFEKLVLQVFDLALRKFITGVTNGETTTDITNRAPVFVKNGNEYKYEHTKEPVEVANGNTVIYTLRIFNEGNVAGYASKVKDDLPEGLEFLPDHSINTAFMWKMYKEDGTETKDVKEAKYIETDFLSKEKEKTEKENLIAAFNPQTMSMPDYRDVKIAFKVTEPNTSDRIIINQAQISDDTDEEGNPVDDVDSTPDEWNEGEDDQDIEKIKVKYFDLSLKKWVTESIVTVDGKTTVTKSGHTGNENPEPPMKVEIPYGKTNTIVVKFRFNIKVTNEGEIAGYAKEIEDYIPAGLKFVAKDNPKWTEKDGRVTTDQLKDKLLQPGESATVNIVLTWINGKNNMGEKVNWAEISKDENEYNSPDIDSTPGNKVKGEDDIDQAPVLLSPATGSNPTYAMLVLGCTTILAGGIFLIKKYAM